MTARSAVRILRDEGLVYTMHGRGSFVADPLPVQPAADSTDSDPAPGMPTQEYTELTRRINEIAEAQNAFATHPAGRSETSRFGRHPGVHDRAGCQRFVTRRGVSWQAATPSSPTPSAGECCGLAVPVSYTAPDGTRVGERLRASCWSHQASDQ